MHRFQQTENQCVQRETPRVLQCTGQW